MAEANIIIIDSEDDECECLTEKPPIPLATTTLQPQQQEKVEILECPICLQTCIHPAKLPCGHIFCFLCVKGTANKSQRCAMCRRPIPPEFLDHPDLVYGVQENKNSTTDDGYQWFYEGRNGGWWQYDIRSTEEIETAYQANPNQTIDLLICGTMYCIDFSKFLQFDKDMPTKKRKIRRDIRDAIGRTKGWWQYDERTCFDIEEAYKKGEKFCTILVAGYVYVVDFETMLQQRQNDPARKRQVKRDLATIPKKGVAGLRIDGSTDHVPSGESTPTLDDFIGNDSGATTSSNPLTATTNLISTIAANAAIRIASDIIDSTLAHVDNNLTSSSTIGDIINGTNPLLSTSIRSNNLSNSSSDSSIEFNRQELLDEVEETLNMSNSSSINSPPNLEDFFSLTIDEFRSLALTNIAESSSDSDNDVDEDDNDCDL